MQTTELAPPSSTSEAMARPLPFEPENFSQVWALANWLKDSSLIPSALRGKPADLMIVIATGRELGLSPMQSVRSLHVVDGKPGMSAELIAARIRRSSVCRFLRLIESSDQIATYASQRVEDDTPTAISFSFEEAQKMGLSGKDNYKKQPATMLRARCISKLGRIMYQDVLSGVYETSELDDIASSATVTVIDAPPQQPSVAIAPKSTQALADLGKQPAPKRVVRAPAVAAPTATEHAPDPVPSTAASAPPAPPAPQLNAVIGRIDDLATKLGKNEMVAICAANGASLSLRGYGLTSLDELEALLAACETRMERPN